MKIILIFSSILTSLNSFSQLSRIPNGKFDVFANLKYDTIPCLIKFESFEISNEVSVKEYNSFLESIKQDSTNTYYLSQIPDSSILPPSLYPIYFSEIKNENEPIIGVSWAQAMEYCKWKTINDTLKGGLIYLYRLPKLSEWLYARSYENSLNTLNHFDKNVSEWVLNSKDESRLNSSPEQFDYWYFSHPDDPRSLKRKIVIGNSWSYTGKHLQDYIYDNYFENQGYTHVGFRFVRIKIPENMLIDYNPDNKILTNWKLKK
jgi:formylglycine-generating enzyme required for sulfatase activity